MIKITKLITALLLICCSAIIISIYAQEPCNKCKENPEGCKLIQTGKCDDCQPSSKPMPMEPGTKEKTIEKKITVLSSDENRGFLGVMTKEEKDKLMVTEVVPNSPAEKAGIRKDDILLEVNGTAVKTRNELITVLQKTKPNETAQFKIKSKDKERLLKITLAEMPKSELKIKAKCDVCPEHEMPMMKKEMKRPECGAKIPMSSICPMMDKCRMMDKGMPMMKESEKEFVVMPSKEKRGFIGIVIEQENSKLVIQSIVPNSPAQKAGLKQGDIIAEVNGTKVSTPTELIEVLKGTKPKDIVHLKIISAGVEKTVDIELGSAYSF